MRETESNQQGKQVGPHKVHGLRGRTSKLRNKLSQVNVEKKAKWTIQETLWMR